MRQDAIPQLSHMVKPVGFLHISRPKVVQIFYPEELLQWKQLYLYKFQKAFFKGNQYGFNAERQIESRRHTFVLLVAVVSEQ